MSFFMSPAWNGQCSDNEQLSLILYSPHFLLNNPRSYVVNTTLKIELFIVLCIFFSETLIATVSEFIKTCNPALVCLYLTDVELSHEGIIKGPFQFWALSDFSVSSTSYSTFCVHCVPHHLLLVDPRLSSSHVPGVSLRNPKIKLRCQRSLVKVWDIWITHHQASSPKDFFTFCSTPQLHSSCTFCHKCQGDL